MKRRTKAFLAVLVAVSAGLGMLFSATAGTLPESLSVMESSETLSTAVNRALATPAVSASLSTGNDGSQTATLKFLGLIPLKEISVNVLKETKLCPGGMAFGVKFFTQGVVVVGMSDVVTHGGTLSPATEAGLETGDVILSMNGEEVNSTDEVGEIIAGCKGEGIAVNFKRGAEEKSTTVYPAICAKENLYKAGIWVRDSTAGIGTVTYVNAETGEFAGLGHGICDLDTGALLPLRKGVVVDVEITDVTKGRVSVPGELKGDFSTVKKGSLSSNTKAGVFGSFDKVPTALSEALPVGLKNEVKEGEAFIYTTLDSEGPKKYGIEIEKIYKDSGQTKNFLIKVTDKALLEKTGGIVQGMSGSPIIQDGKLIGAVTHVLVNDPTKGYGIFIENMLGAAE